MNKPIESMALPAPENNYQREHVLILLNNFKRWTDRDLMAEYEFSMDTLGEQVFNADFYLLSHDRSANPILTYGNQQALDLWEVSWAELTTMYSQATAKPIDRQARAAMMEQVKRHNYLDGYSGVRISKTGKEFKILDGVIWNLFRDNGEAYGQAAWFRSIER
jgi:MEKHLA domain